MWAGGAFIIGFVVGAWATIIFLAAAWAVGFYIDKILWSRVRAAEKTIPLHSSAVIHLVRR